MKHVTFENHTLQVLENKLDFCYVRKETDALAAEYLTAPMQIVWYDGVNQTKHPEVPEGQHKQAWIAYLEGHGGKLLVDIIDGIFIFIYVYTEDMD